MILATRENSGSTPRCIECGQPASYIELHAQWISRCEHGWESYFTRRELETAQRQAEFNLKQAVERLAKFEALP